MNSRKNPSVADAGMDRSARMLGFVLISLALIVVAAIAYWYIKVS